MRRALMQYEDTNQLLKSFNRKNSSGTFLWLIGGTIGITFGAAFLGVSSSESDLIVAGITTLSGGLVFTGTGIGLSISGRRDLEKAITLYNDRR